MRVLRRLATCGTHLAALAAFVIACSAHAADPHKVLRLAQGDIATLDPHQWTDYFSGWVGAGIFEGLYEWDYLARPVRLAANTAEALPKISGDGRTWTMRVKPGIYFTDDPAFNGKRRELTAQDFVYSFKRRLDPNLRPGGQGALIDALVGARAAVDGARKPGAKFDYDAPLDGVRALDRYTIQFQLVQPNYPVMEQYLTDTYAVAREVVEAAGRDIDTRPVGTGPYKLKEWKRGASIVLEANPGYRELRFPESSNPADAALVRAMHGKRLPQIGVVRISIIEEMQSRLLEFERGGLDYLELAGQSANRLLQNGKLKPEYAAAGMRHYVLPSSYVRYTMFNLNDAVIGGLGKEHVALRRAIALSFDSDALINVAYGGQAQTTGQLVGPTSTTYDRTLPPKMPYDPAAARALLDRAGYDKRDAENYRMQPDGKPLTLTILTRPGTLWRDWETLWKKSLDAIGLRATFRELPAQDQFKEMQAGQFQLGIIGWGGSPLGYRALQLLDSRQPPFTNASRFALKAYDDLYDAMLREPDRQKQTTLSREMTKISQIYVPLIPHIVEVDNDFVQPWVSGYRPIDIPSYWKYLDIDVAGQQRGISVNSAAR